MEYTRSLLGHGVTIAYSRQQLAQIGEQAFPNSPAQVLTGRGFGNRFGNKTPRNRLE
jgi:hypothetical protein